MLVAIATCRRNLRAPTVLTPRRSALWFVAVGCLAAAVHWGVVVVLVEQARWQPLYANVAGWLVALGVSFNGHHRLSFRGHGVPVLVSGRRFFVVSAVGFAVNEASYAVLLRWSGQRYELLLALVLAGVAVATYAASRHWAFLRTTAAAHRP
jgi:putative flippase GtrA